jgi:hypothetical protein
MNAFQLRLTPCLVVAIVAFDRPQTSGVSRWTRYL